MALRSGTAEQRLLPDTSNFCLPCCFLAGSAFSSCARCCICVYCVSGPHCAACRNCVVHFAASYKARAYCLTLWRGSVEATAKCLKALGHSHGSLVCPLQPRDRYVKLVCVLSSLLASPPAWTPIGAARNKGLSNAGTASIGRTGKAAEKRAFTRGLGKLRWRSGAARQSSACCRILPIFACHVVCLQEVRFRVAFSGDRHVCVGWVQTCGVGV